MQEKEFFGQRKIINKLEIFIKATIKRNEPLDHVIIAGPSGYGKTTLVTKVASRLNSNCIYTNGANFKSLSDVISIISRVKKNDILFIDEIHGINLAIQECLYSVMQEFRLDIIVGEANEKRTLSIDVEPFTLIGATTNPGLLKVAFRTRFPINLIFEEYQIEDLEMMLKDYCQEMAIVISKNSFPIILLTAKNNPRRLKSLIKRIKDFEIDNNIYTKKNIIEILNVLGYDENGLDQIEVKILSDFYRYFKMGPVGITAMVSVFEIDMESLVNIYEPSLIKLGYLIKTPRGRMLTAKALSYKGEHC